MKLKLSPVKQIAIGKLKKNAKNAQYFMHPDALILSNMKDDIKKRGILVPLIAKKDGTLLAGHSRLLVAGQLKMKTVPVQYVMQKLTEVQEKEFLIKDNLLRRQLGPEERKALYRGIYKDFEDRLMLKGHGSKDVGIDIKHIAEKTGLRVNTVSYDINQMRHRAAMTAAANRKVDALDVQTVAKFKKACAVMLNAATVGTPSTISELAEVAKTVSGKMSDLVENVKRRAV